jgi:RNA polymerase sigma-70 factor (ECF subfamily)
MMPAVALAALRHIDLAEAPVPWSERRLLRGVSPMTMTAPAIDLAALVREHRDALRGVALKLTRGHAAEADDLVQDTFERALARPDALAQARAVRAWLCTIMRHLHIDRLRQQAARPSTPLPDDLAAPAPVAEEPAPWAAITPEQVHAALAGLAPEFRQAYELAATGLPYPVIAERLGIPKNTVGTRVLRARRKLRQLLLGHLGGGDDEEAP